MSGGSYGYRYFTVSDQYVGRMYDSELDEMMKDLVDVLHDVEWWRSGDSSEEKYRETVKKFKKKWFKRSKIDVQKLIEDQFNKTKQELLVSLNYVKGED